LASNAPLAASAIAETAAAATAASSGSKAHLLAAVACESLDEDSKDLNDMVRQLSRGKSAE
jgi:hypothetical protein